MNATQYTNSNEHLKACPFFLNVFSLIVALNNKKFFEPSSRYAVDRSLRRTLVLNSPEQQLLIEKNH